jgi:hypothetical protein
VELEKTYEPQRFEAPVGRTVDCRNGASNVELSVLERLGKVKLEVRTGAAPEIKAAVRSTPHFDLAWQLPEVDHDLLRQRLTKEIVKLEKIVLNLDRQLANEEFINGSMRAKRAEHVAQINHNRDTLNGL